MEPVNISEVVKQQGVSELGESSVIADMLGDLITTIEIEELHENRQIPHQETCLQMDIDHEKGIWTEKTRGSNRKHSETA